MDSRKFFGLTAQLRNLWVRQGVANDGIATLAVALPLISSIIIYLYGGFGVMDGDLSLGVLVAFVALSMRLAAPVSNLASFQVDIAASAVHLKRIFEWIDLEPEVHDSPDATELPTIDGLISVKNATVEHEPGKPIISDLSLDLSQAK